MNESPKAEAEDKEMSKSWIKDCFLLDKNHRPIFPGDTLKVFHFIAALRRERRYMYKYACAIEGGWRRQPRLKISHLNQDGEVYYEIMDGRLLVNYEIVQGYSPCDFRDREKKEPTK